MYVYVLSFMYGWGLACHPVNGGVMSAVALALTSKPAGKSKTLDPEKARVDLGNETGCSGC